MSVAVDMTKPRKPNAKVGAEAALQARRKDLLEALEENGWNLSATAQAAGLQNASNVLRLITRFKLTKEYERAKAQGLVRPGRPTK